MIKNMATTLLLSLSCTAFALDTGWLELQSGHTDEQSGSSVQSVTENDNGQTLITINIPKNRVSNRTEIEEIVVIGKRQKKEEPLLDASYEWATDVEGDYYGLIIKLGKNSRLPIRLHFAKDQGTETP